MTVLSRQELLEEPMRLINEMDQPARSPLMTSIRVTTKFISNTQMLIVLRVPMIGRIGILKSEIRDFSMGQDYAIPLHLPRLHQP
jgi:hypothetical protein